MGTYDVAQICLNGHEIISTYNESPELRAKYCDKCGESTITECLSCGEKIRGYYSVPGFVSFSDYQIPSFCHECGEPYPWTQKIINNAVELVALDDELSDSDKEIIKNSFPDLVVETPTTPVAIAKYKKHIDNAQNFVKEGLKSLLQKAVSEAVRKSLYG